MSSPKNQFGSQEYPWDVIISGAGPAGLTAAIVSARAGLKVILFEQSDRAGPQPRGETVHDHPIFDSFLGEGFLKKIKLHETAGRKFNSPLSERNFEILRKTPSIVFEWHIFIQRLVDQAQSVGVQIQYHTTVTAPIIINAICIGVQLKDNSQIFGKTILACDGHQSLLGRTVQIPYPEMTCPIVKCLIHNFHSDYSGFEYFFLVQGMLDYAPQLPPGIIFVFPRGQDKCEVGLMLFTSMVAKLDGKYKLPSDTELLDIWHRLIQSHPHFSELMHDTITDLEYVTGITDAKMYIPSMPIPGLAIMGDAMGFIEASGASGISCAMQQAQFTASFLSQHNQSVWDDNLQKQFNLAFQQSLIFKHIAKVFRIVTMGIQFLFTHSQTAAKFTKKWWLVRLFYSF